MKKRKGLLYRQRCTLLIIVLFTLSVAALQAQSLGDVNTSGIIDIVDALMLAQYYVGLNPANFNPACADVDCSGTINIVDALCVAQYYVGLIFQFPCTLSPTPSPAQTPSPTPTGGNITIWMAGDSTMANGGSSCPIGYGKFFGSFFNSRATVINSARGGRSINNWLYNVLDTADSAGDCNITKDASGKPTITADWQAMLDGMKAGDYLIISFGINDGTSACPRHADEATFKADLGVMAAAAKARGANPIFMTPVSMISCSGSTARGSRGAYVDYTIAAGRQYNVPVIDLHQLSVNLYNARGFCPLPGGASDVDATTGGAVGAFFCNDHTHFDTPGATAIAQVIANAIANQNPGLAVYLK